MVFGLGGGCCPTALPLSFWKALYSPVSVRELGVAKVPASLPLAGQAGMQQWSSSSVAGGSCDSEQWCRMVVGPEAREHLQGQLTGEQRL